MSWAPPQLAKAARTVSRADVPPCAGQKLKVTLPSPAAGQLNQTSGLVVEAPQVVAPSWVAPVVSVATVPDAPAIAVAAAQLSAPGPRWIIGAPPIPYVLFEAFAGV